MNKTTVYVWDPLVRIAHWLLAACVLINLTGLVEEGEMWHRYIGYTACAVVAVRLLWGLVGSRHARFSDFWPTPTRLQAHWQHMQNREPDPHPGHNPFGAIMMLALWAVVLMLGVSGYLMGTDRFFGEEWLQEIHEILANGLIVLIAAHILAAIGMSLYTRVNLPRAMITGRKNLPD